MAEAAQIDRTPFTDGLRQLCQLGHTYEQQVLLPTFAVLRLGNDSTSRTLDALAMAVAIRERVYDLSSPDGGITPLKEGILADRRVIRLYVESTALAPPQGWLAWIWSGILAVIAAIRTFFCCPLPPVVDERAQQRQAAQGVVARRLHEQMEVRKEVWTNHEQIIPELASAVLDGLVLAYTRQGPFHREVIHERILGVLAARGIQETHPFYGTMNRQFAGIRRA